MSLRLILKRHKTVRGRRWTIRKNKNDKVTEVKLIYNPQEYINYKNAKPMYGDKALLKILENEKEKNNS